MRESKRIAVMAIILAGALLFGSVAGAEDSKPMFKYGGDIRIRETVFDNIPIIADPPGVTRGGENNFFRFRTRLWGEVAPVENLSLRVRAVNEFRLWHKPDEPSSLQRSNYDFPDEVVFDNLYLDVKNLLGDKLDLRIGRQDMIYGTGKVILEGTPKDGSRTIYMNAIKATWKGFDQATLDMFGIHNRSLDQIAINSADRDLTGFTPANDGMTEDALGLYYKSKQFEQLLAISAVLSQSVFQGEVPATAL